MRRLSSGRPIGFVPRCFVRWMTIDAGTRSVLTVTLAETCAGGAQPVRFDKPRTSITIVNTPERVRVRQELSRFVDDDDTHHVKVSVSGVGGIGKSHNLIRFVHEARADGHLVAYMHTAESWVDDFDHIRKEVCFGLELFVKQNRAKYTVDGRTDADFETLCDMQAEIGTIALPRSTLANDFKAGDTVQFQKHCEAVRDIMAKLGKKFIFLMDQDNRLGKLGLLSLKYQVYSDALVTLPTHLTIASASANNEATGHRGWPIAMTQYPDTVDELQDVPLSLIFPTLFTQVTPRNGGVVPSKTVGEAQRAPHRLKHRWIFEFLYDEYNLHPLMCSVAERTLQKAADSATAPAQVRNELESLTKNMLSAFAESMDAHMRSHAALAVRKLEGPGPFDRRLFYQKRGTAEVTPLFHSALKHALDVFPLTRNRFAELPEPMQYEEAFYAAAPDLFSSVGKSSEMLRATIPKAYISKEYVQRPEIRERLMKAPALLRACARAQAVDFFSWEPAKHGRPPTLNVFQLTLNESHADSAYEYLMRNQHFLRGEDSTLHGATLRALKAVTEREVKVRFIFVSPNKRIELPSANTGNRLLPVNWTKVAARKDEESHLQMLVTNLRKRHVDGTILERRNDELVAGVDVFHVTVASLVLAGAAYNVVGHDAYV